MTRLVIIADDLAGALDTAAPFAMRGLETVVALEPASLGDAVRSGAAVIGVSTDSREVTPECARERVRAVIADLPAGTKVFKKIDSRLKGNIGAELGAIPFQRALVAPAIPAFGRWVSEGKLGGFGVNEPIDVAKRLGAHATKAVVPDVNSQADMDAALALDHDLPVGARGLAEAMARQMAPVGVAPVIELPRGRAICVIGSTDPITLEQIDRLRAAAPGVAHIAAPAGIAPASLPAPAAITVLQAMPGNGPADHATVAHHLGGSLRRLAPQPDTLLVISGGATAQVVLGQLQIGILTLVGEALPGLPVARAGAFTLVTKSGGFGDPETLLRLLGPQIAIARESVGSDVG